MSAYLSKYLFVLAALQGLFACSETESQGSTEQQAAVAGQTSQLKFEGIDFSLADEWHQVKEVELNATQQAFVPQQGKGVLVNISSQGNDHPASKLITAQEFGDFQLEFDFKLAKNTWSGVYLLGRYRINLNDAYGKTELWNGAMGGLHPRFDDDREWKHYDGVVAKANPSQPIEQWQHLSIEFRAPRFDQHGLKTAYAELMEVKFNGVTIHQNQIATGPGQGALAQNEVSKGPVVFLGDAGPLALRNIKIIPRDFSDYSPKVAVAKEHQAPLDSQLGKPMLNLVELGKKAFAAKGCKECHETQKDAQSVKTGPNLYGVFSPNIKQHTVISAKGDKEQIAADAQYLLDSIRASTLHIATRTNADGSEQKFFPIMPSYNAQAINQLEIDALLAYLHTLNDNGEQGAAYVWQAQPERPYVLVEDLTAELVSDQPRLARVNIGEYVSGRAYHVGLPNQTNYSFDPRTFAFEMIWSGRFLDLKHEKQGRADAPSNIGRGAKLWPREHTANLFRPKLASGDWLDFSFKQSAELTQDLAKQLLADKEDFATKLAKVDAEFVGVTTPAKQIPTFSYRVNQNYVTVQLDAEQSGKIAAEFTFNNRSELTLALPATGLSQIRVSLGEVVADTWQLPAGKHKQVTFTALVADAPQVKLVDKNIPPQKNSPQPLIWSEFNGEAVLPAGYKIESALDPNDLFGRRVLFEPLGIAFTDQGSAYVSTRTAGVWKITDGKWQQFAEGIFDSMGLVVEDENQIIVGEKAGLTRLIDKDNDGWAEQREVVSDQFRFHANYHAYLHGPVKLLDGSLLYNLNLGHGMPSGYTAGGIMGTTGGYRGWAMQVDKNGITKPYAYGLRSPAGIAVRDDGKVFYTDNQGDYHGTSKLYLLEQDKYYGHPASLVDLPGKVLGDAAIDWQQFKDKRALPVGLLPHGRAMNSPGNPVWQTAKVKFGPYAGQMFVGDQTQSNIFRVHIEEVNGVMQSALLPFMTGTASGVMRLAFSPEDNSLWVGQTGRGWWAKGGNLTALQRIVWDGKTIPQSIHSINVTNSGYSINFTQPINKAQQASFAKLKVSSWFYQEDFNYGSAEKGLRDEVIGNLQWSNNGKSLTFTLADFAVDKTKAAIATNRVYEFDLSATDFSKGLDVFHNKAYYTLNSVPK